MTTLKEHLAAWREYCDTYRATYGTRIGELLTRAEVRAALDAIRPHPTADPLVASCLEHAQGMVAARLGIDLSTPARPATPTTGMTWSTAP